jgi:SAM-dependent methyltransferase
MSTTESPDQGTAEAFATSWLNLPPGSIYTFDQFADWMEPLSRQDFEGKSVLELGCGNGSLLVHAAAWRPRLLHGIDLGDSVQAARANLEAIDFDDWELEKADLSTFHSTEGFDLVFCIGVLHHLSDPFDGFRAVVQNAKPGGKFHCWVYAREGNALVRLVVEPLRKLFSKLPWWITKYGVAGLLAYPVFGYAKLIAWLQLRLQWAERLPLSKYFLWISGREIGFIKHVIFDQLVTPTTHYIPRSEVDRWLASLPNVDSESTYVIFRNGNSWKFGGTVRPS